MANHEAYVLDMAGRPVPVGVPGELYISGAGVARGYLGQPDLTARKFLPDPFTRAAAGRMYRTGDRVAWNTDGTLEFLGRVDEQLSLRGHRIEPEEVETHLRRHPGIVDAAVNIHRRTADEAQLVAHVVPASGHVVDLARVTAWCRDRLPAFMVPTALVVTRSFPLSANGKVDRANLPSPEAPGHGDVVAGQSAAEREILDVWRDVFARQDIGIHDDFFALGGHSLLAMRLLTRMRRRLDADISIRTLFESRTVAALATAIGPGSRESASGSGHGLKPMVRPRLGNEDVAPLSYAQQRMWFVDRLAPGSAAYNLPVTWRLTGKLDPAAMKRALHKLAQRHDALRMTLRTVEGRPMSCVRDEASIEVSLIDLSTSQEGLRQAERERRVERAIRTPFALDAGPLWRAQLLRLSSQEWVFLLVVHHIIADGWSLSLILQDLSNLYAAEVDRLTKHDPIKSTLSYQDFAVWQRGRSHGEDMEVDLDFWRETLAGAPPSLDLPSDRPRPRCRPFQPPGRPGGSPTEWPRRWSRSSQSTGRHCSPASWQPSKYCSDGSPGWRTSWSPAPPWEGPSRNSSGWWGCSRTCCFFVATFRATPPSKSSYGACT